MDAYVGEIRMFTGNFAPVDFAFCNGQQLSIQANTALYAVIGSQFGGDQQTYFNLPNLAGTIPVSMGQGAGLTSRTLGQSFGSPSYALNQNTMPAHTHVLNGTTTAAAQATPVNGLFGTVLTRGTAVGKYSSLLPNCMLDATSLTPAGTAAPVPVSNMQPYLAVNFIICLQGEWPTRP